MKHASQAFDYYTTAVSPWVGKFDRKKQGDLLVLAASDFHAQYTDKFALKVFLDTAKRMQPDVIALNGDVLDLYDLSRFPKDPTTPRNVQGEINFVVNGIFKPLRELCPNSQIDFIEGNHEWRLVKYLMDQAPGMAGLECLEFGNLFRLNDFEINLIARQAFRRQIIKDRQKFENFTTYGDGALLITHGSCMGTNPARAELERWGHTGISGHLHRPMVASAGNGLTGVKTWSILGCMARTSLSRQYMEVPAGWVNGFGYAEIHGKTAVVTPVNIFNGFCSVAGKRYHKSDKPVAKNGKLP
jgi:predicted phosphodiesterase